MATLEKVKSVIVRCIGLVFQTLSTVDDIQSKAYLEFLAMLLFIEQLSNELTTATMLSYAMLQSGTDTSVRNLRVSYSNFEHVFHKFHDLK